MNEDGTPNGAAFRLRKDEEYLSINWLELLDPKQRKVQVAKLRKVLGKKLKLGSTSKITVACCGVMIEHVLTNSEDRRQLDVFHMSETSDPSHGGIFNIDHDDDSIADDIAEVFREVHSAR